jgi:hypothetical protein
MFVYDVIPVCDNMSMDLVQAHAALLVFYLFAAPKYP